MEILRVEGQSFEECSIILIFLPGLNNQIAIQSKKTKILPCCWYLTGSILFKPNTLLDLINRCLRILQRVRSFSIFFFLTDSTDQRCSPINSETSSGRWMGVGTRPGSAGPISLTAYGFPESDHLHHSFSTPLFFRPSSFYIGLHRAAPSSFSRSYFLSAPFLSSLGCHDGVAVREKVDPGFPPLFSLPFFSRAYTGLGGLDKKAHLKPLRNKSKSSWLLKHLSSWSRAAMTSFSAECSPDNQSFDYSFVFHWDCSSCGHFHDFSRRCEQLVVPKKKA